MVGEGEEVVSQMLLGFVVVVVVVAVGEAEAEEVVATWRAATLPSAAVVFEHLV